MIALCIKQTSDFEVSEGSEDYDDDEFEQFNEEELGDNEDFAENDNFDDLIEKVSCYLRRFNGSPLNLGCSVPKAWTSPHRRRGRRRRRRPRTV